MSDVLLPQELTKSENDKLQKSRQQKGVVEAQRRQDMHALMHLPEFRRFLWEMLGMTGMNSQATDFTNVQHQYYLLGRARTGKDISEFVQQYQPEQYLLMIKENMEKEA